MWRGGDGQRIRECRYELRLPGRAAPEPRNRYIPIMSVEHDYAGQVRPTDRNTFDGDCRYRAARALRRSFDRAAAGRVCTFDRTLTPAQAMGLPHPLKRPEPFFVALAHRGVVQLPSPVCANPSKPPST